MERVIRTMRDSLLKSQKKKFEDKVYEAIEKYNLSFHAGIMCTPVEATHDKTGTVMMENSPEESYARRFKRWYREKFIRNQKVRVAKNENLTGCSKYSKDRFLERGRIVEICLNDSYIVRLKSGRLVKKRHYDMKGVGDLQYVDGD